MGAGMAGGEQHEIRVAAVFSDQLSGPLAQAQRQVDAYTASLERMAAAQARAGVAGGLTAGGATVAQSGPPRGGPPTALAPAAAVAGSGGLGGPGRTPAPVATAGAGVVPGPVTVGSFSPPAAGGGGRPPGVVAPLTQQPGGGRPGSQANAAAGSATGGGRSAASQNVALRFAVQGARDVEAVSGAMSGILQSALSLRTLATGGGLAALVGIPMQLANEAERAQRAFSAMTGSVQAGSALAQQVDAQLAQQPYDVAQTRGAAVTLGRVGGGRFATRAPSEVAAITQAGAAAGLGPQDVGQIESIFASAQSYQSRMRMTGEQMSQLADLLPAEVDPFQAIATARNQAHPGEHWTAQSLRNYLMGGGSLPGGETTNELTQALQSYAARHPEWRQAPDVLQGEARNRATQAGAQLGTGFQQALTPALSAAAQGDVGGTLAGLLPWNLAGGNVGAGLAIGAGELVVGGQLADALIRAPFRAVRPITRLGRTIGVIPRGRTSGGPGAAAAAAADPLVERAAAVGLTPDELGQVARQMHGTPEQVLPILERSRGITPTSSAPAPVTPTPNEAAAAVAPEPVRRGAPGGPPTPPPGAGTAPSEAAAAAAAGAAPAAAGPGRAGRVLGVLGELQMAQTATDVGAWIGQRLIDATGGQNIPQRFGVDMSQAPGPSDMRLRNLIPQEWRDAAGNAVNLFINGGQPDSAAAGTGQQAQTANEQALRQTQTNTTASRDLYDESVRLTRAFSDLEQIVRALTQDFVNSRNLGRGSGGGGGGAAGPGGPPAAGAAAGNTIVPTPSSPLPPGVVPQPGDVAGWRSWLQGNVPSDVLAANPTLVDDMLAGAQAESGLDPNRVQQGGGGRGFFQTDVIGGKGVGATQAQLFDPNWQLRTMLPAYVAAEQQAPAGLSPAERASWVDAHAELPAGYSDPTSKARRRYAAAYADVAGVPPAQASPDVTAAAQAPVSPDIGSGSTQGNTIVQTGDINVPATVGGVPQDAAGRRQWARDVSGVLMEEIANGVSDSSAGTAPSAPGVPLAYGG